MTLKSLPPLTENEIHATYIGMRNRGESYIGEFGDHPIGIDEWKKRELDKLYPTNNPSEKAE